MRKETSAGIIAGAVSGLPLAIAIDLSLIYVFFFFSPIRSRLLSIPTLANGHMLLFIAVFGAIMYLAIACFIGGIAGLIFVSLVSKIPIRSTYVKAMVPTIILWLILIIPFSPHITQLTLLLLAFFVGDSVIFGYLFNRWTKAL
jgi:hypothetical protein